MAIALGNTNLGINIDHVRLSNPDSLQMQVQLSLLVDVNNHTILSRTPQINSSPIVYLVAVNNPEIADTLYAHPGRVLQYLTQTATPKPGVFVSRYPLAQLPDNEELAQSSTTTLSWVQKRFLDTAFEGKSPHVTLFVGIAQPRASSPHSTASPTYTLLAMDALILRRDGAISKTNVLLFEGPGHTKLWRGRITQRGDKWYKGEAPYDPLYAVLVPNTIVTEDSSLSILKGTLSSSMAKFYNFNSKVSDITAVIQKLHSETTTYFSPLYTAKLDDHGVGLFFAFNRKAYFQNHGLYSNLIKNPSELNTSFSLLSTKIFRRRVVSDAPISRLTGGGGASKTIPDSEELLPAIPQFYDLVGNKDILTLGAIDKDFGELTFGTYAYGVEFEFLDHTSDKLRSLIDSPDSGLDEAIKNLDNFFATISRSPAYNRRSGVYSAKILSSYHKMKFDSRPDVQARKSYLRALHLFYPSINIDELDAELAALTGWKGPGPSGLMKLSSLLNGLKAEIETILVGHRRSRDGEADIIEASSQDLTSTRRTMKLKFYFQDCVDADDFLDFGYDYLNLSNEMPASKGPFKVISYDHMQNIMDREATKTPSGQAADIGDLPMSGQASNTSIYLTPNFLTLGKNRFTVNSSAPDQQENNLAAATLLTAANLLRSSAVNFQQLTPPEAPSDISPLRMNIVNSITAIMGANNCTPQILSEPATSDGNPCGPPAASNAFGDIISPTVSLNSELIDAADILSEKSPFIRNTAQIPDPSTMAAIAHGNHSVEVQNAAKINLEVLCHLIQTDFLVDRLHQHEFSPLEITSGHVFRDRGMSTNTIYQDVLEASTDPEPKNALIALLANDDTHVKKPSQQELDYASHLNAKPRATEIQAMALKYGMIRKCQYLAGFKKLNNIISPAVPTWVDFTVAQYNTLRAKNTTVLCRLVETDSKFKRYDGVRGPLYNKIFIISPYGTSDIPQRGQSSSKTVSTISLKGGRTNGAPPDHYNKYAHSVETTVGYNQGLRSIRAAQTEKELQSGAKKRDKVRYTDGRDYRVVNGGRYAGAYHIHIKENGVAIAMEGPRHSNNPHRELVPVSKRAKSEVAKAALGATQNKLASSRQGY